MCGKGGGVGFDLPLQPLLVLRRQMGKNKLHLAI